MFSLVLGHLCSVYRSPLKYSRIAQVPLFMLHGSRISTPVMYSLRLIARPYKEKKCVFPETCFGIYYKMYPELKSLCSAWILSQKSLTVLRRRVPTRQRVCESSYRVLLTDSVIIGCSAYKNICHSCLVHSKMPIW